MFFVVMIAAFLVSARIASNYKKNILDVVCVVSAGLILAMYLLSFFRALSFISVIAAVAIVYCLLRGYRDIKLLADPFLIFWILMIAAVGVATKDQVFTWWDDINFWSSDAKQIFFLNGFPGKYGNVSPEFGDYPPATSLFKWLFLQISSGTYVESLQFLGYFALNAVFLLPLLARIKSLVDEADIKAFLRVILAFASNLLIFLFPGVFSGIIYYGTPADITMAIVYGALLLAIVDRAQHGRAYYYTRIGLFTAVLLLTKSIGFEWAIFALIFYFLVAEREKWIWIPVVCSGCVWGCWLLFCLVNRRVAKLTGVGIKMATSGKYSAPANAADKLRYFVEGFWLEPMHSDHNVTLDLTTGTMVILIFVFIAVMYQAKVLGRNETRKIALFTLITGIFSYGIVFLAHISIFQTEDQYLDAYAMGISISRYCAPFTIGSTYLLLGILFNRMRAGKSRKFLMAAGSLAFAFVMLCADYSGAYKFLYGYRESIDANVTAFDEMVGDDGHKLVNAVSDEVYWGKRVLVLRDGHEYYWVHNTYISKMASPTALVYDVFMVEEDTADSIRQKIIDSHADYFYVEDTDGISEDLFMELLSGEVFEPGIVYDTDRIMNNG